MNCIGKQSPLTAKHLFAPPAVSAAILALLSLVLFTSSAAALEQTTTYLPLKVNSSQNQQAITEEIDRALADILANTNSTLVSRAEATQNIDYQGQWPPSLSQMTALSAATGASNIAVGTLTVLGNQISIDFKLFDTLAPTTPTYFYRHGASIGEMQASLREVVGEILAQTERAVIISSIAPEGNKRIDSGAILRKVRSKSGDIYNPEKLRDDLRAIFQMGYFDDVQIDVTDGPKGKDVVFTLREKPVISSLIFAGLDELEEQEVSDAANIKENGILNPAQINRGAENIKALYKSKGYYNTQVTTKISYPDPENAVVRYVIEEGEEIYIKKISFEGNSAFDDDELEDVIETSEKGWLTWLTKAGLMNMDELRQDAGRIVAFYQNHGYLDAKIGEPIVKQEQQWLFITFAVEEGTRYRVGTIDFTGELIRDKEELLAVMAIRDEEFMSRQTIRNDILAITDMYAENGYAFADIRPKFNRSSSGKRLDVTFDIHKGELVYISRIDIRGNTRTRDNVIRRELKIAEGGIFDSKALRTSSQRLQRLGYFSEVNVTPEPSLDPTRMNIIVSVKEKSTGQFSIGAGYSSVDKLVLMGEISENNFLGRGDTLALSANLGGTSTRYNLSYTDPHYKDSQFSWGVDLYNLEREYDDYTKDSKGGAIRMGYPIFEKWRIYGSYSYEDTTLSDVSDTASFIIRNSVDIEKTSAVKLTLRRDTRNKRFGATDGSRHSLSVRYAGGPLSGDSQFTKVEGSTSWYFPLFSGTSFHFKAAAGQVFENETDKLPVYERFFLGGLKSIRGFDSGKVSPRDPDTAERIGGDKMWYSNFEFIFPILEKQGIQGVVFYDIGRVFNDDEDWGFEDYDHAAGLGLRWVSPIGPMRIEWGYNLDPATDEDESVWDFSIGGIF